MSGSGGRPPPPGRTLPKPFAPAGGRPAGERPSPTQSPPVAQPAQPAQPDPGSTSPGHAPAAPAPPPRGRPSQPPPMGAPAAAPPAPAAPPPVSTQPMPSPPPPAAPRPMGPGATQIGPGFAGPPAAGGYKTPVGVPPAPAAPPAPAPAPAGAPGADAPAMLGGSGVAPSASAGGFAPPPPVSGGDPMFMQGYPPPPSGTDSVVAMPARGKFAGLAEMSLRRAFRVQIRPDEVLPPEHAALELASVADRNLQAYLAWRRSVVLIAAVLLAPLAVLRIVAAYKMQGMPALVHGSGILPALAEAGLCGLCVWQLGKWTQWRKQHRMLLLGWLGMMAVSFVVYLYPLSRAVASALADEVGEGATADGVAARFGAAFALVALFALAPKVLATMAGAIRSSLVAKLLFPGSSAPGWMIVVTAAVYAVVGFLVVVVPYQLSGSGWFVLGMAGLIAAQFLMLRLGWALARPGHQPAVVAQIQKMRSIYLVAIGLAALFLFIGLARVQSSLELGWSFVFTTVLAFAANTLLVTVIGSDLLIQNLERARTAAATGAKDIEDSNQKLAAFVSGGDPPSPPPFG